MSQVGRQTLQGRIGLLSDKPLDIDENSINAYRKNRITFNVKLPGKFYFMIDGKIIKVYGDTKWEMVKRWFGKMND